MLFLGFDLNFTFFLLAIRFDAARSEAFEWEWKLNIIIPEIRWLYKALNSQGCNYQGCNYMEQNMTKEPITLDTYIKDVKDQEIKGILLKLKNEIRRTDADKDSIEAIIASLKDKNITIAEEVLNLIQD